MSKKAPKRAPRKKAALASPKNVTTAPKLTRAQAAKVLGVSTMHVRRLEKEGTLTPAKDAAGWHWFDAGELERVRAARALARPKINAGDVAADAFALFKEGRVPVDAVVELRIDLAHAKRLYEDWKRAASQSDVLLPAEHVAALHAFGCVGPDGVMRPGSIVAAFQLLRDRLRDLRRGAAAAGGQSSSTR